MINNYTGSIPRRLCQVLSYPLITHEHQFQRYIPRQVLIIHTPMRSNHTYPDKFQSYVPWQEHWSADGHTAQRTCFLNSLRDEAKVQACATECGRVHPDSPVCCAIREGKKRRDKAKKERSCSGGPQMPKPNSASFRNSDSHWLCIEIQQSRWYYVTG